MSILIKDVLVNGEVKDILIKGNKISKIAKEISESADKIIDGKDKVAIPSFMNSHTHAAMTLLRGYADDLPLQEWLETKIWPFESKLTEEDVYWGAKLACMEMIKSGTTFFNDMYWHYHGTARAVEEMGIRAAISYVFIDLSNPQKAEHEIEHIKKLFDESKKYSDKIKFVLGPHAIYTVSKKSLQWMKEFADKNNLLIHIHLSETKKEVEDCIKMHGKRPVEYLDGIDFLGKNIIATHVIHVNDSEIEILKKHDVKIVYNPVSNMKLASGIFPYEKMKKAGLKIGLGTDGCSSNNNLNMLEEMKIASLLQKINSNNPTILPAYETFKLATKNLAGMFGIDSGRIEEGKLADLILINLKDIQLNPKHNLISNLIYSANPECIDTTICDGKILMQNRKIDGEEEIIKKVNEIAERLGPG